MPLKGDSPFFVELYKGIIHKFFLIELIEFYLIFKKEGGKIDKPLNISETKLKMLQVLKKRELISGEDLSKELLMSRTAIWKNVQSLQKLGYKINSISGKGYIFEESPDLLYPWELSLEDIFNSNIYYFKNIDSTNKFAAKLESPALVVAEVQNLGKGRLKREWVSKKGGLYSSLVLKPQISFNRLPALSLVVSVALAETFRGLFDIRADIKWPNDIMIDNKKLSGILVEASGEMDEINKVIIGIGVNVNLRKEDFPYELINQVTTIKEELSREVDRKELINEIVRSVLNKIKKYEQNPAQILDIWRRYSCTIGNEVVVSGLKEGVIQGEAMDIDDFGALIVNDEQGKKVRVTSGDVTLKLN